MGNRPPPAIPSAEELYDLLMGKIEPELTTRELPKLAAKYKGESRAEAAARRQRYRRAYEEYERRYRAYIAELHGKVDAYRRHALGEIEERHWKQEESALTKIEEELMHFENAT
jgi:hypothetical protein